MIVEFYGLPASGKTTDMKAVLQKYNNAVDLTEYSQKIKRIKRLPLACTPEFISFFFKAAKMMLKKKKKVSYDLKIFYVFCCIYIRYMYYRKHKAYDYYLIDHGIVQNIVSALWNDTTLVSDGQKIIAHLSKYFKNEIAFIYTVNSDNKKTYERIINRKNEIRLKTYSYEDAEKILKKQAEIFGNLNEEVQKHFPILQVDSLTPFEGCFDKICTYLDELK